MNKREKDKKNKRNEHKKLLGGIEGTSVMTLTILIW